MFPSHPGRTLGWAASVLALACVLNLPATACADPFTFNWSGDLDAGYDDNIKNAGQRRDIEGSSFLAGSLYANYERRLSPETALLARGSLEVEAFDRFNRLNNGKLGALGRFFYRPSGGFHSPTFAVWGSAAYWEFRSRLRDSNEYRAGVFVLEQLTTRISGRLGIAATDREARNRVFDLACWSTNLDLDWLITPAFAMYGGYRYQVGDVVSTSTPGPGIRDAAEAIADDDVFRGNRAYRLDAKTHVASLGFNYALSRGLSLDAQTQYVDARGKGDNNYQRWITIASLLKKF